MLIFTGCQCPKRANFISTLANNLDSIDRKEMCQCPKRANFISTANISLMSLRG